MARDLTERLHEAAVPAGGPPDLGAAWRSGRRRARRRTAALGVGAAALLVALGGVGEAVLQPDVRFAGPGPGPTPGLVAPGVDVSVGPSAEAVVRCWELGSGWGYTESVEPDGHVSGNGAAAGASAEALGPDGSTLEGNGWTDEDLAVLVKVLFVPVDVLRDFGLEGTDAELVAYRAELRERLEGMQRCATVDVVVAGQVVGVPPAPAPAAVSGTLLRLGDCLVIERDDGLTAALDVDGLRADVDGGRLLDEAGAVVAEVGSTVHARGQVAPASVEGCPSAEVLITEPAPDPARPASGGVELAVLSGPDDERSAPPSPSGDS